MRTLRLALGQINTTVGDLAGNTDRILATVARARALHADIVSLPELAITGYPPEDLLLKPQFIDDNLAQLQRVIAASGGITVVVGFVDVAGDIYNAAAVIADGHLKGVYRKQFLPNYGVFDENRYFQAGDSSPVFTINGVGVGVNICEDIWYPTGPTALQCFADALVIVNINASPFHVGKVAARNRMLATRASDNLAIIAYTNLVGGQDELVFDGNSAVFDARGELIAQAAAFEEDLLVVDVDAEAAFRARLHDTRRRQEKLLARVEAAAVAQIHISDGIERVRPPLTPRAIEPEPPAVAQAWSALALGLGDYVRKNGFRTVVVGLSGGIDSSVTAALAVEALGADQVIGVRMPSRYSSEGSLVDAQQLADNLGIRCLTIPIVEMVDAVGSEMVRAFEQVGAVDPAVQRREGIAFENLQARLRGMTLMALSNQFGWLVLMTGNKSESAVGYTTLYGDSVGAYAPIKDVPKTMVYELAEYVNRRAGRDLIPRASIEKPPSAELRPNQLDEDSLPPYPLLDAIIQNFVVEDRDLAEIVALGFDEATVRRVARMVYASEFKRRQVAPGTKITPRAFGKDRRWPITNRYAG